MSRPPSIVRFEQFFLASIVIGLVNTAVVYAMYGGLPGAQQVVPAVLAVSVGLGIAVNLILWFFIARRGSNGARWVMTVLFALGLVSLAFSILMGTYPQGIAGLLGAAGWVLQALAVWHLFRPDTIGWFRGQREPNLDETFR